MKIFGRRVAFLVAAMAGVGGLAVASPTVSAGESGGLNESFSDIFGGISADGRSADTQSSLHLVLRHADGSTETFTGDTYLRLRAVSVTSTTTTYEGSVAAPISGSEGGTGDADLYIKMKVYNRTGDADLYVNVKLYDTCYTPCPPDATYSGSSLTHIISNPTGGASISGHVITHELG
jgi:hypothetical protein